MAAPAKDPAGRDLPGYLSAEYGASFGSLAEIVRLPNSGLSFLRRQIDGALYDLIGPYPYAMSANWRGLVEDGDALRRLGAVSVTFVADPFCAPEIRGLLSDWTLCRDFKTHFAVDLRRDWRWDRQKEIRRNTRRALELQSVDLEENPERFAPELWDLYQNTISRFDLHGMQAMSADIIARQLAVKGALLHVARDGAGITGAQITFDHGATANLHLLFLSSRAQAAKTSYALLFRALEGLERRGCLRSNLGGAAGMADDASDGLAQFKRRWSNESHKSLLCGNILDRSAYGDLCVRAGVAEEGAAFFPAYRKLGGPFEWRPPGREGKAIPPVAEDKAV